MGEKAISKLIALAYQLPDANTLYRVDLPPGTSRWNARPRGQGTVKLRFDRGIAPNPAPAPLADPQDQYWTIAGPADVLPGELADGVTVGGGNPFTLYLETPDAGLVVEILVGI